MKTDRYTKIVLTVIAAALVCIVFQNIDFTTPARANTGTSSYGDVIDVRIVSTSTNIPVDLKDHNLGNYDAIPVQVTGHNISSYDAIPVNLKDHDLSSYDAIPVEVRN